MATALVDADLFPLDVLGPRGPFRTRDPLVIRDVTGQPAAQLSLAPAGYVNQAVAALRAGSGQPGHERLAAIQRAGRAFASKEVAGLTPFEYQRLTSRVSGLPLPLVQDATRAIAQATQEIGHSAQAGRPATAVADWRDLSAGEGRAVWCRRGEVLTVIAAGNHPAIHVFWLDALVLGYCVVVRPSTREPFTAHRLVAALHAAGIGRDQLVLLPTAHAQVDQLIDLADLAVVYGGDEVARRYAADAKVLVQGPGRSKILITADRPWQPHLDVIVHSIADNAGAACVNATAVLTEHDPDEIAGAIAERLVALDAETALPLESQEGATRLANYLGDRARGTRPFLGADQVVRPRGDGSAVLHPALHRVPNSGARQLGTELPFPCAWVAPWQPAEGIAPLRGSLVLTAITGQDELFDRLLREPSICNVYGSRATHWYRTGLPHDGFLTDFLMRSKTVTR